MPVPKAVRAYPRCNGGKLKHRGPEQYGLIWSLRKFGFMTTFEPVDGSKPIRAADIGNRRIICVFPDGKTATLWRGKDKNLYVQ